MGESGTDPIKGQETAAPARTTVRTAREEEKNKGIPLRRILYFFARLFAFFLSVLLAMVRARPR